MLQGPRSSPETPQGEAHRTEATTGGLPLTKSPPGSLAFPTGFMMSSASTTAACGPITAPLTSTAVPPVAAGSTVPPELVCSPDLTQPFLVSIAQGEREGGQAGGTQLIRWSCIFFARELDSEMGWLLGGADAIMQLNAPTFSIHFPPIHPQPRALATPAMPLCRARLRRGLGLARDGSLAEDFSQGKSGPSFSVV